MILSFFDKFHVEYSALFHTIGKEEEREREREIERERERERERYSLNNSNELCFGSESLPVVSAP